MRDEFHPLALLRTRSRRGVGRLPPADQLQGRDGARPAPWPGSVP